MADVFRAQCQMPAYFGCRSCRCTFSTRASTGRRTRFQRAFDDNVLGRSGAPTSKVFITSCAKDDSPMSLCTGSDARELADTYRSRGTDVSYQPTDCSMDPHVTDLYGWGTDLFGMQTSTGSTATSREKDYRHGISIRPGIPTDLRFH